MEWRSIDSPSTPGWGALEHEGERLALVQPFAGRAAIVLYNGPQPWKQRQESAASIGQGKRFAERWSRARAARSC